MKYMMQFLRQNPVSGKSFQIKNYRQFLLTFYHCLYLRNIYKLSRYLETMRSIKKQCPVFLKNPWDNSDLFIRTVNNFSIIEIHFFLNMLLIFYSLSKRFSYQKYLQTIWKLAFPSKSNWADSVQQLRCPSGDGGGLSCPLQCLFLGLSLALRSNDHFKAPSTLKWALHILLLDGHI